ncbi:MAG: hypothetical protein CXZ00_11185 [Acidobacteria bacterium]|nr:MAG: hypothetical protein CXZ00_11185 [Acidobacteriota bacterium]
MHHSKEIQLRFSFCVPRCLKFEKRDGLQALLWLVWARTQIKAPAVHSIHEIRVRKGLFALNREKSLELALLQERGLTGRICRVGGVENSISLRRPAHPY